MSKKKKQQSAPSAPAETSVPASAETAAETAASAAEETATASAEETAAPAEETAAPAAAETTAAPNGFQLLSKYRGAIMGLAAVWILIFHEWIQLSTTPPEGGFDLISNLERYIKAIGFCGVDIFLMLSGIGLTFAIKKDSLGRFYYRRLRRILLPFLTVAVIRCVLEHWDFKNFLGNVTGWKFYTVSMYSFLWFVPAICTLYLLFPLYYKLFQKAGNKILFTCGTVGIWMILTLLFRDKMRGDLFGFTNRIPVFCIGVLYGRMTQNRKEIVFTAQTWITVAITALLGFYLAFLANFRGWGLIVPVGNCCIPNCLIAVSFPFLLAKGLDLLVRKAGKFGSGVFKVLAFFGTFSLEYYCVQEWLAGILIPKMQAGGWTNLGINVMIFLAVTLSAFIASRIFTGFWKLAELPAKKLKAAK